MTLCVSTKTVYMYQITSPSKTMRLAKCTTSARLISLIKESCCIISESVAGEGLVWCVLACETKSCNDDIPA